MYGKRIEELTAFEVNFLFGEPLIYYLVDLIWGKRDY